MNRGMRDVLLAWGFLFASTCGVCILFGTPLESALRYLAYQIAFAILPGVPIYALAARRTETPIAFATKVVVVGQCFEMTAGLLLTMLGWHAIYPMLPFVCMAAVWLARKQIRRAIGEGRETPLEVMVCCGVAIFLVFAASLSNFDEVTDQHFTWIAAFANVVVSKWPPVEPFLMDVPLHYHYLFNMHVGMASKTADVPLVLVASRLAIVFHAFVFIMMMCTVASSRLKAGWLGIVAALALLLNFGLSEFMWKYLHMAMTLVMYQVASTMIAFEIFLVLIDEVLSPRRERMRLWLLVSLVLLASGARAMTLPMLAGGVGLLALFNLRRERFGDSALLLLLVLAGFVIGSFFFLGLGQGESDGTRLVFLSPLNLAVSETAAQQYSPLVNQLLEWGLPSRVAVLLYLIVALCGRMAFLLPFAVYALATTAVDRDLRLLLGGTALAGVGLLVLIEAVVPQEIWAFYWFADIALALLGVAGLKAMWSNRLQMPRLMLTATTLAAALFAVQVWDFSDGFSGKLATTSFPMAQPIFRGAAGAGLEETLSKTIRAGDVLVTGGQHLMIDDRTLAAGVVGLQLYASRIILPVYAARTKVAEQVASRMWLLDDDLALASSRQRIRDDVRAREVALSVVVRDRDANRHEWHYANCGVAGDVAVAGGLMRRALSWAASRFYSSSCHSISGTSPLAKVPADKTLCPHHLPDANSMVARSGVVVPVSETRAQAGSSDEKDDPA